MQQERRSGGGDSMDDDAHLQLDLFSQQKKQKKTLKTKGLDKNGYDKSKCEAFFEKYKACKTVEYEARRKARVDARRGRKKE